ncbi:MAG: hypothetical protein KDB35_09760 [Acidimicrobiales bacterium]|nr:hypothetical protein [Acidimicrobiales bacterium]MCB1016785.1 hypothetical protein [Acidimicrobiales bacterium]MCB9374102.1 hypothetical protein [Microthrixaceae bacterium]
MSAPPVDSVAFLEGLAAQMNAHPDRYEVLGDCDLVLGVVVQRPDGQAFRARITFEGIACLDVCEAEAGDEALADCWLEGPLDAWSAMVDDIVEHGRATGRHTLNSLTLMGESIRLRGQDVMGIDKFSRFNQSLQEFFDGAAARSVRAVG